MKDEANWRPSKFVQGTGGWTCSRDPAMVARGSRLNVALLAQAFEAAVAAHCAGRLLDLGCGRVPLYGMYRPHVQAVHCVDWGDSMHPLQHIDRYCDLNEPLPLADAEFDTVILSDVLEHIYRPHALMAEVARVLRPEGKLLLSVPFLYWIHEEPHDYYRYTSHALRRIAGDAGLQVLSLEPVGGGLDVLADMLGKSLARLPARALDLGELLQGAALRLGRSAAGQRLRQRTARQWPLGYLMVAQRRGTA